MTKVNSWVVYRMTIRGKPTQLNAVCEEDEWHAMELAQPGHHTLIRAGITNEGEAERLARKKPEDGDTIRPMVGACSPTETIGIA